jgi:single-strand DNA-binding protein
MNANTVTFAGFATASAEYQEINGRGLAEFTIAYNRKSVDGKKPGQVDFIDVKVWGKHAAHVAKSVKKGEPLVVVGPLRQDRWEDRDSGKKHSRVTIEGYVVARQLLAPKAPANEQDAEA